MGAVEMTFEQRVLSFWSKVNKAGPIPADHPEMSNCWIWEGAVNIQGYGTFCIGVDEAGQRNVNAHRVAFFLANGYFPNDDCDHLCHVKLCQRPSHLRDATHQDNINNRRCSFVCKRGHPLEDPNLYYDKKGRRKCRRCMKIYQERARSKRDELRFGT